MTLRDASPGEAERFLPESHGALMTHEHVHRYALAASVLGGRRVLDLGSGAGYGTRLLRAAGARVVGLDLDVGAARRACPAVRGSALRLPFADASFEAVVCFEMIEHVREPERVVAEIARVLAPDGVAFISTPDRHVYTDRAGNRNPYHLRELTREEFAALLGASFPDFVLHGQSLWAGSWLARLDAAGRPPGAATRRVRSVELEPDPRAERAPWVDVDTGAFPAPLYLVAVCARSEAALDRTLRRIGGDHLLHDREQRILGEHFALARAFVERDAEIASAVAHARNVEAQLATAAARVASLESHGTNLERELAERDGRITSLHEHVTNLERELGVRDARARGLEEHGANLGGQLRDREARVAALEEHAANLEEILRTRDDRVSGLEAHVRGVEQAAAAHRERVDGLEQHVANLEAVLRERRARVGALEEHARNVEIVLAQRDARIEGLEKHAHNLETLAARGEELRGGLEARIAALEPRAAEADFLAERVATLTAEIERMESRVASFAERNERAEADARAQRTLLVSERDALRAELDRLRGAVWRRLGRRLGLLD